MAGEIPPLNITVNLETSGVQTGVNQATTSIKSISAAAGETAGKFANLKTVMLGTFASSALQKGLSEFEGFLKESVKAAEEAQTSIAALGTAMNNAKVNTDVNREAIMHSSEAMLNLGFKATDTRNAFTKMITATGSVTESTRLLSVAADYARLKHEDLTTAASTLTRGTTGAMRAFREFGITLDTTLPKNQAISKAFDELNKKIGGQAAAYAETYAGKLAIMGAKSEDLKEKIGALLLPILTKLESWFIGSLKWLGDHKAAMEAIAFIVGTVLTAIVVNLTRELYAQAAAWLAANIEIVAIVAAVVAVAAAFVWAWNKFDWFRHGVVTGIEAILDVISFLIRAIGTIAEAYLTVVTGPMRLMLKALGFFVPAAKTASEEIGKMPKAVGDFFDNAAKKVEGFKTKVDSVKDKKIDIKFPNIADELAKAGGKSSGDAVDITGLAPGGNIDKGAAKAAAAAKKQAEALKKAQDEMTKLQTDYETALKDRQDKMDAAAKTRDDKIAAAQETYNNAVDDITRRHDEALAAAQQAFNDATDSAHKAHDEKQLQIWADYQDKVDKLAQDHNDKLLALQVAAADKAAQIEQQGVDKRKSIIQQSIDVMTSAWNNATKISLDTLFTEGGSTAGGLVGSLKTQLDKILQLQKDAGDLAAQGYSQSFINQVLAKGPEVGDQMAQAVLNATPETASQIKSLYGQIDTVSQSGLDQLAKTMNDGTQFATQAMAKQYADVAVEVSNSLAKNNADLQASLAKENAAFSSAVDQANAKLTKDLTANEKSLQDALASAQLRLTESQAKANQTMTDAMATAKRTLDASLLSAQSSYETAIKAISDSTDKQLTALMAKIDETAAKIQSLGGTVSGIGATSDSTQYTPGQMGMYVPGAPIRASASGGFSTVSAASIGLSDRQVDQRAMGGISVSVTTGPTTATASDIAQSTLSAIKYGMVGM